MKLYLLRHGKADWPGWQGADDDRPLTAEGEEEMRIVALALKRLKVAPGVIWSSPLPRALSTAEIAGKMLGIAVEVREELRPGCDFETARAMLRPRGDDDVMLVGHEPDLSAMLRGMTGARLRMPKAATACVEIDPDTPAPRLLWLMPAKSLIRLYR